VQGLGGRSLFGLSIRRPKATVCAEVCIDRMTGHLITAFSTPPYPSTITTLTLVVDYATRSRGFFIPAFPRCIAPSVPITSAEELEESAILAFSEEGTAIRFTLVVICATRSRGFFIPAFPRFIAPSVPITSAVSHALCALAVCAFFRDALLVTIAHCCKR